MNAEKKTRRRSIRLGVPSKLPIPDSRVLSASGAEFPVQVNWSLSVVVDLLGRAMIMDANGTIGRSDGGQ